MRKVNTSTVIVAEGAGQAKDRMPTSISSRLRPYRQSTGRRGRRAPPHSRDTDVKLATRKINGLKSQFDRITHFLNENVSYASEVLAGPEQSLLISTAK